MKRLFVSYLDQGRRPGFEPASLLNCFSWALLQPLFRR